MKTSTPQSSSGSAGSGYRVSTADEQTLQAHVQQEGRDPVTVLGLVAGTCTTLSFLPQVVRTLRSRHARDLSAAWLLVFGLGTVMWLAYGVLRSDVPVAVANGVTFVLVLVLIVAKYAIEPVDQPSSEDAR
jgi:MtN3 and saliva related transmembrane protein